MAVARASLERAAGEHSFKRFQGAVAYARAATLAEGRDNAGASAVTTAGSAKLFARSPTGGAFLCAKLDPVYQRYLLATDTKACVSLLDCAAPLQPVVRTWVPPPPSTSSSFNAAAASTSIYDDISVPAHSAAITVCSWYPADCGVFLTGGMDSRVVAWDTLRFAPAFAWALAEDSCPVYCLDIRSGNSPLAAVGSSEMRIRLLDLRTCALTHSLLGHTEAVMTVQWLKTNENLLVSGSKDGTIRLWDVRRSGASAQLAVCDRNALSHSSTALTGATASSSSLSSLSSSAGGGGLRGHTSNPSASSTITGALSHPGGVNCLVALDAPTFGEYGGAGEPSPQAYLLFGKDAGSGGGSQTGDRGPSLNACASTATPVPPRHFSAMSAAATTSTASSASASASSLLLSGGLASSWSQAAMQAEVQRTAGSLMQSLSEQSALTSTADAAAAALLEAASAAQKPAPFALRTHLFSSGWDHRPQSWDLVMGAPIEATEVSSADDGSKRRTKPAVAAGLDVPFSSLAETNVSIACTGVNASATVKNQGRRCIFPAVARIGGSSARPAPGSEASSSSASSTHRQPAFIPVALPSSDLVVFMPSTEFTGPSAGDGEGREGGSSANSGASRRGRRSAGASAASSLPAAAQGQGVILALELASGRVLNVLRGHQGGPVNAVCYRDEPQELYSAGTDGCILLWSSPLLRQGGSGLLAPDDDGGEASDFEGERFTDDAEHGGLLRAGLMDIAPNAIVASSAND